MDQRFSNVNENVILCNICGKVNHRNDECSGTLIKVPKWLFSLYSNVEKEPKK